MSYARGFGWNLAFNLVSKVVTPLVALLLMRRLAPDVFGMYAILQSAMLIADTFREAGLVQTYLKERDPTPEIDGGYVATSVRLGAILGLALLVLAYPIAELYGRPEMAEGMGFAALATLLNGPSTIPYAKLLRRGDLKRAAQAEAVASVVSSLYVLAVVYAGHGFLALASGLIVRSVLFLLATQRGAPTRLSIRGTLDDRRTSRTLTATSLLWTLYSMGDAPLVAKLVGLASGGLYGSGKMIVQTADVLAKPILQTAGVAFAHRSGDPTEVGRTLYKALAAFALGIAPVYLAMGILAGPVIRTLLPPSYHGTADVLPALCAYGAAIYPGSFASSALLMAGRPQFALRHWVVGVLAVAAIVAFARPSLYSAAWTFAGGLIAVNAATLAVALRTFSPPPGAGRKFAAAGLAPIVTGALAVLISRAPMPEAAQLGIAVLILPLGHAIMIGAGLMQRPFAMFRRSGVSEIWRYL
ncbi:MAG: oligosaccharide flippase family protein [Fimbriimonas sp.]